MSKVETVFKRSAERVLGWGTPVTAAYRLSSSGDEYLPPYNRELMLRYALKNAYHARAIATKVACTVGLGYSVEADSEADIKALTDVLENETEEESFYDLLMRIVADMEGCGHGFLEFRRNRVGEIGALGYVPAHTCYHRKDGRYSQHWPTSRNKTIYDKFTGAKHERFSLLEFAYPASQIFPKYPVPEWLAALNVMDLDVSAIEFNTAFFTNHAMPRYGIVIEGDALKSEYELALKNFFRSEYNGARNAHRAVVIQVNKDTKVHFEPLTKDVQEASFLQLRNANRDEILSAHGMMPRLMGIVVSGSLGGSGETTGQLQIFKQATIRPKQSYIERRLNRAFAKLGFKARIRFKELDVTTHSEDMRFWADAVQAGLVDVDTARAGLGFEARSDVRKGYELANQLLALKKELQSLPLN